MPGRKTKVNPLNVLASLFWFEGFIECADRMRVEIVAYQGNVITVRVPTNDRSLAKADNILQSNARRANLIVVVRYHLTFSDARKR